MFFKGKKLYRKIKKNSKKFKEHSIKHEIFKINLLFDRHMLKLPLYYSNNNMT